MHSSSKLQIKLSTNTRKQSHFSNGTLAAPATSKAGPTKSNKSSSKVLSVSPVGRLEHGLASSKNNNALMHSGGHHHFGLTPGGVSPMGGGCLSSANVTPQHNFKRDTSKQTLGSEVLLNTESSIQHNGHRDNIKVFAFKPGGGAKQPILAPNLLV